MLLCSIYFYISVDCFFSTQFIYVFRETLYDLYAKQIASEHVLNVHVISRGSFKVH